MKTALLRNILICLLTSAAAMAQETQREIRGQYRIVTQPTQLLVSEITLNAERIMGKRTIGIFAAYRYPGEVRLLQFDFIAPAYSAYLYRQYEGLSAGINTKNYFSDKGGWYLEGQLFYRHWWKQPEQYNYTDYFGEVTEYRRSASINVYGSKFLLGYSTCISRHGMIRPLISLYSGVGLRLRQDIFREEVKTNGVKAPDNVLKDLNLRPSFQLGCNLGIEIFKKPIQKAEE